MDKTLRYKGRNVTFCDLDQEDYTDYHLLGGGWYEPRGLEFVSSLNVKGNYVDVGAYIGNHSMFYALFCPSTHVYSFEPQIDIFNKLKKNIEVNNISNCTAYNLALSDEAGRGAMTIPEWSITQTSWHTKPGKPCSLGAAMIGVGDCVEISTLDSFNLSDVKLMKLDAENMELKILKGAVKTLEAVEHLFIEIWPQHTCIRRSVEYNEDVLIFVTKAGFTLRSVFEEDLHYFSR